MKKIADLATDDRMGLRRLVEVPFLALGARVGRFEPPFESLRDVFVTFDPIWRFVLAAAAAGDEAAIALREFRIRQMLPGTVSGGITAAAEERARQYLREHAGAIEQFRRAHYPWLAPARGGEAVRPAALDELLDETLAGPLQDYGFELKNRKRKKSEWRCTSFIREAPIALYVDKGPSKAHAYVEAPDLLVHADVGHPFFFSQVEIVYGPEAEFRSRVQAVFAEYVRLFPHVLSAIDAAVPIRDAYLAGDPAAALDRARRLAAPVLSAWGSSAGGGT
jgi:hypothetical protein